MTTNASKPNSLRPLEGYTAMTDADIVARAMAVLNGMTGNSNFQNVPVDLTAFRPLWRISPPRSSLKMPPARGAPGFFGPLSGKPMWPR